jgi:ribosomal protein S18 acetylase RimI-like enzyme
VSDVNAVVLAAMTPREYDDYLVGAVDGYAQSFVDAGILTPDAALDRSRRDFAELLPDGVGTAGQHLFTARAGGRPVGILWLHMPGADEVPRQPGLPPDAAFVYDISVRDDQQRKGYGQAIMAAGIEVCRAAGLASLRLNVFGHNVAARALYEKLGFDVMSTQMKLDLRGSAG